MPLRRLGTPHLLGLLLIIKLAMATVVPLTGDEAYFVLWGRHLDYGYYDHPPMAGWMTALQLQISDHRTWLRLPGVLAEFIVAGALYWLLRPHDPARARTLALICLITPLSLLFVFTLTDTGCLIFVTLAFVAAARGLHDDRLRWPLLAGSLLGLAFLSKYFAVLFGIGLLIHQVLVRPRRWRQGLIMLLAAIPFGLVNLHWNFTHCWTNLLFNLANRNVQAAALDPIQLFAYVGLLAYLLLPPVLLGLRDLPRQAEPVSRPVQDILRLARVIGLTGLFGFLLISLNKAIGLHWLLWLQPFLLLLFWPLPLTRLARIRRQLGGLAAAHLLVLAGALASPLSWWGASMQWNLIALREAPVVLQEARRLARTLGADADTPLATPGYTAAAVLAYQSREPVMVIGTGSRYARQDDFWTDFRALDGRNVIVLVKRAHEVTRIAPWFNRVRSFHVDHRGQRFHFVLATGFRYAIYRDTVLSEVRDRYYSALPWLPAGECPFTSRYFPVPQS